VKTSNKKAMLWAFIAALELMSELKRLNVGGGWFLCGGGGDLYGAPAC